MSLIYPIPPQFRLSRAEPEFEPCAKDRGGRNMDRGAMPSGSQPTVKAYRVERPELAPQAPTFGAALQTPLRVVRPLNILR